MKFVDTKVIFAVAQHTVDNHHPEPAIRLLKKYASTASPKYAAWSAWRIAEDSNEEPQAQALQVFAQQNARRANEGEVLQALSQANDAATSKNKAVSQTGIENYLTICAAHKSEVPVLEKLVVFVKLHSDRINKDPALLKAAQTTLANVSAERLHEPGTVDYYKARDSLEQLTHIPLYGKFNVAQMLGLGRNDTSVLNELHL